MAELRETVLPIPYNPCRIVQAVAGLAVAATVCAWPAHAETEAGYRPLHARQRPRGRGGAGPPRAGRHPHGLVQGRRRRRDARQIRHRTFPRTSDVQGHCQESGRASSPQAVAAVGGQENAFTTHDYTGYFQRVSRDNLKMLMEFEADRMTGLVLDDAAVVPELKVVLEEYNQRVANNPRSRLSEQIDAALYLNHPYGRPVIGWRHEIEKLNREDALAFYKRFYTPTMPCWWSRATSPPTKCEASPKRPTARSPRSPRSRRAAAPQEPPQVASAPCHAGRSAGSAAEPASRLSRALGDDRKARRIRSAGGARVHPRPRPTPAGSIARSWSSASSPSAPAAGTAARLSTPPSSASSARRSPACRCRSSKTPSTP